MDAYQLRSAISDLQNECYRISSENQRMRSELGAICSSVNSATNSMANTYNFANRTLEKSTNIVAYSDNVMQEIANEQEHIAFLYHGFKNIETANKKIRELNNKLYFGFSNYRMVRKIVRAFIDNTGLDMVSSDLIFRSVEKEHLQSPDFWLSCSMLAIMHWKEDDAAAANRALEQAMSLDERQTVLFFMSFNFLLGRKDAAFKWFQCYCKMEKTGEDSEFILLLLHATNLKDNEEDELNRVIKDYLFEEYNRSIPMNDRASIVEMVKDHLVQYNSSRKFVFDYLRNFVKDYSEMVTTLTMAKDNEAILDFVETTNSASRGKGYLYIEKFINNLLETPDKKERQYTDEIAYNEEIIRCVGDITKATEAYNNRHKHDVEPLNLMKECIDWLFSGQSAEVSEVARCNIFLLCKDVILEAAEKYFAEYRARKNDIHPVAIKDYSTKMDFTNKSKETKKIESFYAKKKDNQLATVKNTTIIACIVAAAVCLLGSLALMIAGGFTGVLLVLGVVLLVAAGASGVVALVKNSSNKKKRQNIIEANDLALAKAKEILDKLFVEYEQYQNLFEETDKTADDIIHAINR